MARFLAILLTIDYAGLAWYAWTRIDRLELDHSILGLLSRRTYHPFYSELFSEESKMLFMIVLGSVLAIITTKFSDKEDNRIYPVFLTVIFAVLAAPLSLYTKGLIAPDKLYHAFALFFCSLLLYFPLRHLAGIRKKHTLKEFAILLAIISGAFYIFEPWNSPSLKLKNAIKSGNSTKVVRLLHKYPVHASIEPGLLDNALANPDFNIIKALVENGHKSIYINYRTQKIFDPANLEILKYLNENGVDLTGDGILRNAIEYRAKNVRTKKNNNSTYPVLTFLIQLNRTHSKEKDKKSLKHSQHYGFTNPASIAAAKGDIDLVNFLLKNGFKIDEDFIQALSLNGHIDKPEFQSLLSRTEFALQTNETHMQTDKTASQNNDQDAHENKVTSSTPEIAPAKTLPTKTKPVFKPKPVQDGLDLILSSGVDVKRYRDANQNIFHFLAQRWQAIDNSYSRRRKEVSYESVFKRAIKRKIDLNQKDINGLTPLWHSVIENNFRAFVRLIEAGADPNIPDNNKTSMLEYCRKNNRLILLGSLEQTKEVNNE